MQADSLCHRATHHLALHHLHLLLTIYFAQDIKYEVFLFGSLQVNDSNAHLSVLYANSHKYYDY